MDNQITNPKTTEVLNCAKVLLDSNNPQGARALLDTIPENERTGEWYYLLGKTESLPPQTPTVNANVNLSFNKKPKEVKPKKPPERKTSSSTIQREIKDLKKVLFPIFLVFLVAIVAFSIFVKKLEKEREERINLVRASAIHECEQFYEQYKKNPYVFQYIELDEYKLDAAIKSAQKYGHSITSFKKYQLQRGYTQLKIDNINRMFKYLPQRAEGYYPERSELENVIAYIDFLEVLQPFYNGSELNQLIAQRQNMETTLEWAEAAVKASYPELYVD